MHHMDIEGHTLDQTAPASVMAASTTAPALACPECGNGDLVPSTACAPDGGAV